MAKQSVQSKVPSGVKECKCEACIKRRILEMPRMGKSKIIEKKELGGGNIRLKKNETIETIG